MKYFQWVVHAFQGFPLGPLSQFALLTLGESGSAATVVFAGSFSGHRAHKIFDRLCLPALYQDRSFGARVPAAGKITVHADEPVAASSMPLGLDCNSAPEGDRACVFCGHGHTLSQFSGYSLLPEQVRRPVMVSDQNLSRYLLLLKVCQRAAAPFRELLFE